MKEFTCSNNTSFLHLQMRASLIKAFAGVVAALMFSFSFTARASNQTVSARTRIYLEEPSVDSVVLKFDNRFLIPVSVRLLVELNNLQSVGNKLNAVVPANTKGFVIARFRKTDSRAKYNCAYNWKIVLGDVTRKPDLAFAYSYPYLKGSKKYPISQGPDGHISHQHFFAYDFVMPLGTPVTAARDGIIAYVKQDSDKGGADRKFIEDANYISVYHSDGTMGNYFHLKKDGASVKEGQLVKKGEIIGYSGNTGFSNGAHLHFEVIQPNLESDKNVSVAFLWEGLDGIQSLAGKNVLFSILGRKM